MHGQQNSPGELLVVQKPEIELSKLTFLLFAGLLPTIIPHVTISDYSFRLIANNAIYIISALVILHFVRARYLVAGLVFMVSAIIFTALSATLMLAALFLPSSSKAVDIVAYPVIAIGYYPPGVDLWFFIGISVWAVATSLVMLVVGLSNSIISNIVEKEQP